MEEYKNPSWFNDSFLVEVVKAVKDCKEDVEVFSGRCGPAVPPGCNYFSELWSISVDFSSTEGGVGSIKLIVKTPVESGLMREVGDFCDMYSKEVRMYKEVLPMMYNLSKWKLAPKSFPCPLDNSLALEDLRLQGYKMADRIKRLDAVHCRRVLVSLAGFHALSVALGHSHPDLLHAVGRQFSFRKNNPEKIKEENLLKFFLRGMIHSLETLQGCVKYIEIIDNLMNNCYDHMTRMYTPSEGLNVLNHGDMWTNNLLFSYNGSGDVVDVKFIDFQLCRVCSFAHDLYMFWWTSADEDVREHHREEMFELYRENLNISLEQLNCKERLTKGEFDKQMRYYAPFSLQVVSNFMTVMMADPERSSDLRIMNTQDCNKPINKESQDIFNFESKYYTAVLPSILRQMEQINAFAFESN